MKSRILITLVAIAAAFSWQVEAQTYDTNNVVVQTFAGSAFTGYVDGVGQLTMFNTPMAIVADSQGNLFVWDNGNNRIRKIAPDATVTTFAGGGNQSTGIERWTPKTRPLVKIDFRRSAGSERKQTYESKTETA